MIGISRQFSAQVSTPILTVLLMATLLFACQPSVSSGTRSVGSDDEYIDFTMKLLKDRLDSTSWEYATQWYDSAGWPAWKLPDGTDSIIPGMTCIGKFSCYPLMIAGELYEGNILGDLAKERLLFLQGNLSLTMYGDFHFFFYSQRDQPEDPFASYALTVAELTEIQFRRTNASKGCQMVLQFRQSPSTYMNEGLEIIQIESDTAMEIFSQLTAFYDWKDYGKSDFWEEYGQEKLAADEGYRETSEVIFSDEDRDGIQEIDVVTIAEIVTDTMPMDIKQLKAIRRLSSTPCRFQFDSKAGKYLSKNPACN